LGPIPNPPYILKYLFKINILFDPRIFLKGLKVFFKK
jgi:hypothetical protein